MKKAIIAVAHRLLTAVYHMLLNHEPYRAPEAAPVDEHRKGKKVDALLKQLSHLGYTAHLEPLPAAAA